MEPDLIGQEKVGPRLGGRNQHCGPAMEPDLIGQEKRPPRRGTPPRTKARNGA